MPWTARDAPSTIINPEDRRKWAKIANRILQRTGDEGYAKRVASGVMKRLRQRRKSRAQRRSYRR